MSKNHENNNGREEWDEEEEELDKEEKERMDRREFLRKIIVWTLVLISGILGVRKSCMEHFEQEEMMEFISAKGGKYEPLVDNHLCNNVLQRAQEEIPEERRDEKPIEIKISGETIELLPYVAEQLQKAQKSMESDCRKYKKGDGDFMWRRKYEIHMLAAGSEKAMRGIKIIRSGATNREQFTIFLKSLTENKKITLEKLKKGEKPEQSGRAAYPCGSFHEAYVCIDVPNWVAAYPYLKEAGFVGGFEGMSDDAGHFCFGECELKKGNMSKFFAKKIKKAATEIYDDLFE